MKKKKAKKSKTKKATRKTSARKAEELIVDRRGLARLLECSARHITELEGEGVLIPLRRGRGGRASVYALETVIPAYLRRVTESPGNGAERDARRRRDTATARLTELRIAREEGTLVDRDEVILAGQNYTKAWSAKIRYLPRQLVQTGLIPRASEEGLKEMVYKLLTEISRWDTDDAVTAPGKVRST